MKKITKCLLTGGIAFAAAAAGLACFPNPAGTAAKAGTDEKKDSVKIVATVFPIYDLAREIIGDNAGDSGDSAVNTELTLLLDNGVDLHSYQPTVDDILTISNCDIFLYVGGESDAWVSDALSQAMNEDMQVVSMMDVLKDSVREEELVEGMEAGDEDDDGGDDAEDPEYDEHVWLSLRNAGTIVDALEEALCEADPDGADRYQANAEAFQEKLSELDGEYQAAVEAGKRDTLLFADRFPFRYLADDYGLNYYAAFSGCSAETEASFETIIFLAGKVDELELPVILTIDGSDQSIAETVRNSTKTKDQEIQVLDSMQSITKDDMESGTTYLSVMEENLGVLKEALS